MNEFELKRSSIIDEILGQLLEGQNIDPKWIEEKYQLSKLEAETLYDECSMLNDEVFIHKCIYELSFMDEPPTIARIMRQFYVPYILAKKIFDLYMENN